jgi:hypothetical protein
MQPGSWVNLPEATRAERVAGVFALLCIALAALILGQPHFSNASLPPRGIGNSAVAIQVIQNLGEVDDILSQAPSPDREAMRIKQYIDFGFIASYLGLFLTLAFLLISSAPSWGSTAGIAAAICAVAAAVFDVREDFAILRILDLPLEKTTAPMMNAVRIASAAKWLLSAVTLALLSTHFLRDPRWARRTIGALLLVGGIFQAYGLANNVWLVRQGLVLGLALIGLVVLFFRVR